MYLNNHKYVLVSTGHTNSINKIYFELLSSVKYKANMR